MVDGFVKIGCQSRTIEYWIEHGEQIGKENGISELDIKQYENWIKSLNHLTEETK